MIILSLSSKSLSDDLYGSYLFTGWPSDLAPTIELAFSAYGTFSHISKTNDLEGETATIWSVRKWSINTVRDDNQYISFNVTIYSPNNFNGVTLKLKLDSFITIYGDGSCHGPYNAEIRYRFGTSGSFSGFTGNNWSPTTGYTNYEFILPTDYSTKNSLEIRIYGWNAACESHNHMYFDNVKLYGSDFPTHVELTSLTAYAVNKHIVLNWKTAAETDNYGFDIERALFSTSPIQDWKKIGFVNGSGNSNSPKDYIFIDKTANAGKYTYRLKQINVNGSFEFSKQVEVDLGIPMTFSLGQNYPNPFNPATMINYQVPVQATVKIDVFNVVGEMVTTLVNEVKEPGYYEVTWNAASITSGVYFFRINAGGFSSVKKMMLMK